MQWEASHFLKHPNPVNVEKMLVWFRKVKCWLVSSKDNKKGCWNYWIQDRGEPPTRRRNVIGGKKSNRSSRPSESLRCLVNSNHKKSTVELTAMFNKGIQQLTMCWECTRLGLISWVVIRKPLGGGLIGKKFKKLQGSIKTGLWSNRNGQEVWRVHIYLILERWGL